MPLRLQLRLPPKGTATGTPVTAAPAPRRKSYAATLPTAPSAAEKVIVILRDGRKFIGILRSFDQFGALCCAACFWEPGLPGRSFVARFNSVASRLITYLYSFLVQFVSQPPALSFRQPTWCWQRQSKGRWSPTCSATLLWAFS